MESSYISRLSAQLGAIYILLIIALPFLFSDCSGNKTYPTKNNDTKPEKIKYFNIGKPTNNQIVHHNEPFIISLQSNRSIMPDSIAVASNKNNLRISETDGLSYSATLETKFVGNQYLNVTIYFSDSLEERHTIKLFVLPNTIPANYSYKVLRTFEHDPMAYTQGLIYYNGYIYESTGRNAQSSLRRIDISTGKVLQKSALESNYFGEGIALINNEIYMLTYVSQIGFVYDASSFNLIRKFNLQTREGWGLTTNGSELILSDGSATLFFYEPKHFTLTKQIEVCDNSGLVSKINELEFTKYGLFANIYGEKYILVIDENTGIVKGKIDLTNLFPKKIPDNYDYVLNGIAFNEEKKTFYVTGKQWPVIYEIKINID